MTVIRPNSISGVTSITALANEINVFRHNGVLAGLQLNGVNHHTSAGISTFHTVNVLGNLDVAGVLTYQDVTNVDSLGIGTFRTGINVSGGQLDVGGNIKLGNAGVITATSFSGDGSNLTGISAGTSLSGSTNNTVCTVTGANAIQGEANLTFDGSKLGVNISSPHYTLDVNGDNGGAFTASTNSTAGQLSVVGKNSGGSVSAISRIKSYPSGNGNTSQMAFETRNSSSQMVERVRINSYGQVGINTSVGGLLSVAIDSSNTNALATGFTALNLKNTNTTDNTSVSIDFNNSVGGIVGRFGAQFKDTSDKDTDLYFATRADGGVLSEALRITSQGNVGLGTATPHHSSGYATLSISGSTGGQIAFYGGTRRHYIWGNTSGNLNIAGGYTGGGDVRIYTNGSNERLRIDSGGHVELRNSATSHQELRWFINNDRSASIGWGNGSANWEFKHFRADSQANNPYANIDFFTGSTTSPTRALRITEDGNHIREKHSRFATRINYSSGYESAYARLTFHTPHVNVGNDFSSSRFTAPVDGDYAFWFHTNVEKSGGGSYFATWYVNGSEANSNGGRMYDQHSGSGWNNLSGCIMLNLSEGDYVDVYNGGQSVNYDGNSYGQWMGWLVG